MRQKYSNVAFFYAWPCWYMFIVICKFSFVLWSGVGVVRAFTFTYKYNSLKFVHHRSASESASVGRKYMYPRSIGNFGTSTSTGTGIDTYCRIIHDDIHHRKTNQYRGWGRGLSRQIILGMKPTSRDEDMDMDMDMDMDINGDGDFCQEYECPCGDDNDDDVKKSLSKNKLKECSRREVFSALSAASTILGGTLGLGGSNPAPAHAENFVDGSDIGSTHTVRIPIDEEIQFNHNFETFVTYPDAPIIPFASVREQKLITLDNGLRVLLVNDVQASQSTAALVVHGPGQFQDPKDLPGASHLIEHLVLSYKINSNGIGSDGDDGDSDGIGTMDNIGESPSTSGSYKNKKKRKYSYNDKIESEYSTEERDGDFEDWLADREGTSNAFTAYDQTCFHFNCPNYVLPAAIERFASLFMEHNVMDTIWDEKILAREIRRVDAELDLDSIVAQQEYVTKSFVEAAVVADNASSDVGSSCHPYSKFTRGSLESLETIPRELGINVPEKLMALFRKLFLPTQAVLVVVSNQSSFFYQDEPLAEMQRWVAPFGKAFSKSPPIVKEEVNTNTKSSENPHSPHRYHYPGRFKRNAKKYSHYDHLIIHRDGNEATMEKMTLQWIFNEDYRKFSRTDASEVAFVLNQILGRRGAGSLYNYLASKGWIQNRGVLPPQITIPINVSGLQLLRMDLSLTFEGFLNRSNVLDAVYKAIGKMRDDDSPTTMTGGKTFSISNDAMSQYMAMAELFGSHLTPRPPDAVELGIDSVTYGADVVSSRTWYRFPAADRTIKNGIDISKEKSDGGLRRMQEAVNHAFQIIEDPRNALVLVTAGDTTIARTRENRANGNNIIPPSTSFAWKRVGITNSKVYPQDMLPVASTKKTGEVINSNISGEEQALLRPVPNPFIPTALRPPRIIRNRIVGKNSDKRYLGSGRTSSKEHNRRWTILVPEANTRRMILPRGPPEINCRCVFVMQLLSPRPSIANAKEAAFGKLWELSLEDKVASLAEQAAAGSLAYEIRFNRFGMRVSFLGPSQTLPLYAEEMVKTLFSTNEVASQKEISLRKSKYFAVSEIKQMRGLPPLRKNAIVDALQRATEEEVKREGETFLQSCVDIVCFSQGDLTLRENKKLLQSVQDIVAASYIGLEKQDQDIPIKLPSINDLIDTPTWKPRNGISCYVEGIFLMSDACGRVLR